MLSSLQDIAVEIGQEFLNFVKENLIFGFKASQYIFDSIDLLRCANCNERSKFSFKRNNLGFYKEFCICLVNLLSFESTFHEPKVCSEFSSKQVRPIKRCHKGWENRC